MATKIEGARERAPDQGADLRAVALADEVGVESLSMRRLAQELGVVPMALYKHVANKDELFDGMIDVVVGEIDPPIEGRGSGRRRCASASCSPVARCSPAPRLGRRACSSHAASQRRRSSATWTR